MQNWPQKGPAAAHVMFERFDGGTSGWVSLHYIWERQPSWKSAHINSLLPIGGGRSGRSQPSFGHFRLQSELEAGCRPLVVVITAICLCLWHPLLEPRRSSGPPCRESKLTKCSPGLLVNPSRQVVNKADQLSSAVSQLGWWRSTWPNSHGPMLKC